MTRRRIAHRSDAWLLERSARDAAAFRELYERYAERLHGYMLRRTRSAEAARDLTAETFACAWEGRTRFRDEAGGSAGPWLFGIARNLLVASVRSGALERRTAARLGLELEPVVATPDESWLEGLDELLDELPEAQREAVRLRVLDDLAYEQIAAAQGTTTEAARVRVHRGLRALRSRIDDKELTR